MTALVWVLIGAVLLEGIVLGIWVYSRGTVIEQLQGEICVLRQELDQHRRVSRLLEYRARLKEMTGDEKVSELRRYLSDWDIDSGVGKP